MNAPDSLLAVVAYPVEVLAIDIGFKVRTIGDTAGILVGVRPDFARVVLQVKLGNARVSAILEPADDLGFGDACHIVLLVETSVEHPHATHEGLGGILRGTAGKIVVPGVTVLRRNEVDGLGEVIGNRRVDLVDGCLGHVLHLRRKRQRESFIPLGKFPQPETSHKVRLTQVPCLIVARKQIVIHRFDGLQREIAAVKSVIITLPGGIVLIHGRCEETVCGGSLLGARGAASVIVIACDHSTEQVDPEDTATV